MSWQNKLLPASFRGVPFNVLDTESSFGRRIQTHEFPNRDKPYSEDLGRATRRTSLSAYLVGDDYQAQCDKLITAIEQAGPGKLQHPFFGELIVCIDGDIRVSHSSSDGRMCTVDFNFVEAGELTFPSGTVASSQQLISSCDKVIENVTNVLNDKFSLSETVDFIKKGVLDEVKKIVDVATKAIDQVNSVLAEVDKAIAKGQSLLAKFEKMTGIKTPAAVTDFVKNVQDFMQVAKEKTATGEELIKQVENISRMIADFELSPRTESKADGKTLLVQTQQRNLIAQALRVTAITEAVRMVAEVPAPNQVNQSKINSTPTKLPLVNHPTIDSLSNQTTTATPRTSIVTYDMLIEIRELLNTTIDSELLRVIDDELFISLNQLRVDMNRDISQRLAQVEKTINRTPDEILPALVLAADWYDSAARENDIISRNAIIHPGFIAIEPLKVPIQ